MDSEVGFSVEALPMLGVDYKDQLALKRPKKQDLDYHGQNCEKMEEKGCEKHYAEIFLSREKQDYYFDFEGHMQDPDYMKERLRKWVKAVATYIHFLDAFSSQYPHADIA